MSGWDELTAELDAWAAAGRVATLWWRDDDAVQPSAALDWLIELVNQFEVPVALAVVPAGLRSELAIRLVEEPRVTVLQHGYAHTNHAPPGEGKSELGTHRPINQTLGELAAGWLALGRVFGDGWLKVMVPPYNRIAPSLAAALPAAGYIGLSTYEARHDTPPGLVQVNTHVDIMDWIHTRGFLGEDPTLALMTRHLQRRRLAEVDAAEPTGLLTHHLAHDAPAWNFIERLMGALRAHSAVRWLAAAEAFTAAP